MYKPKFNKVLVEIIPDVESKYGSTGDGNIGGEVFREGTVVDVCDVIMPYGDTRGLNGKDTEIVRDGLIDLKGKTIMWHEGHEAGTVFEEAGKKYALIFWWDICGVKSSDE